MSSKNDDDDDGWGWLYAVSAEVAGKRYLSFEFRLDSGGEVGDDMRGFHLFSYAVASDGSLDLRAIDEDKVSALIRAGKLEGTAEEGTYFPDIRITASSADLVAILATPDAAGLFSERRGPFKRVMP